MQEQHRCEYQEADQACDDSHPMLHMHLAACKNLELMECRSAPSDSSGQLLERHRGGKEIPKRKKRGTWVASQMVSMTM